VDEHRVRPGPHSIRVKCENYAEETRAVTVASGKNVKQDFALVANVFGYLTIVPVPAEGTVVKVNGRVIPAPWSFVKVVPGRHVVVVDNEGLRKQRKETVNVRPNDRLERTINLLQ
jgi:hypothetical protein